MVVFLGSACSLSMSESLELWIYIMPNLRVYLLVPSSAPLSLQVKLHQPLPGRNNKYSACSMTMFAIQHHPWTYITGSFFPCNPADLVGNYRLVKMRTHTHTANTCAEDPGCHGLWMKARATSHDIASIQLRAEFHVPDMSREIFRNAVGLGWQSALQPGVVPQLAVRCQP